MAIAALLLWMCTAAAGGYLLATGLRSRQSGPPAPQPHLQPEPVAATTTPARPRDRFDPPSLAQAKSEPLPGMRALAEFAHPALAIIGFGFWMGYVITRDRVFAAIGFGLILAAIAAGLTWAAGNARAAKRAADSDALTFPARLLLLHALGAALTLLLVVLITARV